MSEDHDVGAVAPVTDEAAPAAAVKDEPEVETPAAEPKPYEPPEDLGALPEDEPIALASPAAPALAPAPVPAQSYQPRSDVDVWGKSFEYSGEDVYAKGSKLVEEHVRERVSALASTVGQVVSEMDRKIKNLEAKLVAAEGRPAPLPKTFIAREHKTAADFCSTKLREFSGDPAWANPRVRGYMESGVRQYLKDAATKAKRSGDMSDYNYLAQEGFLDGVFLTAKIQAGYKGGAVPGEVSNPAAALEHPRSRGAAPADEDVEITSEMKAAAKAAGVPLAELKKQLRASQKWNKERA
jgi:hypothetical protein